MKNLLKKFIKDESGATAIEYGLIAALIAVVCIPIMGDLGDTLALTFTEIEGELEAANAKGGA